MQRTSYSAAILVMAITLVQPAYGQFARTEVLTFELEDKTVAETLNGSAGKKIVFAGVLRIPKAGQKHPAVVLMHGAGGVGGANSPTDLWSNVFNAAGIATFNVDGYSPRGITTLAEGQRLSAHARVQDAFGALEVLAKHPLIDAKKIAIMGFSHGGPSAIFSNVVRFQKKDSDVRFAAHISMYGVCSATLRGEDDTTSPLLVLHGSADDWVPAAPCKEYADKLKAKNRPVTVIEYPDSHHVFDSPLAGPASKRDNVTTAGSCRFEEVDGGKFVNVATKQPLTPVDACMVKGPTAGYNEAMTKKANADAVSFLKDVFQH